MVMEGTANKTLRLGAGHIPGTVLPGTVGNAAIAAHRDTFFRNLKDIQKNDRIRFSTTRGVLDYRVSSTMIVNPADVDVLLPQSAEMLTLVTCYPFYYIGPAPKRFVVQAVRDN
jgi:sortase A